MSSGTSARVAVASERLVDELARTRRQNGRLTLANLAAVALATLVHAVTLAFAATGVLLLWPGTSVWHKVLGVLCLLLVWLLRPRFHRAAKGAGLLDPTAAPETRRLVAEVAEVVGSPMPTRCRVDRRINASAALVGLRGRELTLGAPLWAALTGQERIALLGHELGHFANGDVLQGRYVGTADDTLDHWAHVLEVSASSRAARTRRAGPGLLLAAWAIYPARLLVAGYQRALELAAAPSSRRQEHYADLASARAAGSRGAIGLLEVLLASPGIDVEANRAAVTRADLGEAIRAYVASYDDARRAAVRRTGDVEESRIDSSHPPTMQRIRLIESLGAVAPVVVRTESEWAAIDAEWQDALTGALKRAADDYRYVR